MSKRDYIPWPEKCAALICLAFNIPYEHAKLMHVDQVNGLVDYDHYPIPKAAPHNGPDKFFNLTPRLRPDHRFKTATKDIPMLAKGKRIRRVNEDFQRRMLAKVGQAEEPPRPKSKWPQGRKMQSRPFPKRVK